MVIIVVFATSLLSLSIFNIKMLFHLVHVYNISITYLISSLFLPFGIFVLWAMCNNVFLNRLFSVFLIFFGTQSEMLLSQIPLEVSDVKPTLKEMFGKLVVSCLLENN